jgi:hypothetical protein
LSEAAKPLVNKKVSELTEPLRLEKPEPSETRRRLFLFQHAFSETDYQKIRQRLAKPMNSTRGHEMAVEIERAALTQHLKKIKSERRVPRSIFVKLAELRQSKLRNQLQPPPL